MPLGAIWLCPQFPRLLPRKTPRSVWPARAAVKNPQVTPNYLREPRVKDYKGMVATTIGA